MYKKLLLFIILSGDLVAPGAAQKASTISSATNFVLTKGSKVLDWFCFASIFASQTP